MSDDGMTQGDAAAEAERFLAAFVAFMEEHDVSIVGDGPGGTTALGRSFFWDVNRDRWVLLETVAVGHRRARLEHQRGARRVSPRPLGIRGHSGRRARGSGGRQVSDEWDARQLQEFIWDDLPLCGCGDPNAVLMMVHAALEYFASKGEGPTDMGPYRRLEALTGPEWAMWLLLYVVDKAELVEHGSTARFGWLLPKGDRALAAIRRYGTDTDAIAKAAEEMERNS